MPWQSLKIEADQDIAALLGEVLLGLGALAVSIEDARAGTEGEQPTFGEPGEPQAGLWRQSVVSALFDKSADLTAVVGALELPLPRRFKIELIADQDWVRHTQAQFAPIRISDRLWITPTWHAPPDDGAVNLVLDPGMAFGTGAHPTTRFCLEWLDGNIRGGESVLDYGCGSGILAIAALKLGAGRALGVDIDPQALSAARQNAAQNRVSAAFELPEGPTGAATAFAADVVVANILSNPLKELAPRLASLCLPQGQIVLSGILAEQAEEVAAVYRPWFDIEPAGVWEGWTGLAGVKR